MGCASAIVIPIRPTEKNRNPNRVINHTCEWTIKEREVLLCLNTTNLCEIYNFW